MSFLIYDLSFLVVFILAIAILFFVKRKNFKWEGILLLYRTNIGVELIDRISKKYKKTIGWMRYIVIISGVLLMIAMVYLLFQLVYIFIKYPAVVQAVKVPPLTPLIPYLPSIFNLTFLPPFYFTYWIIAIAIVAIFHEAFHGIFARYSKVRVKSTGFGFLGPFLAAFVEPDEKQMQKTKTFNQMAILGAGTFANVLLTIIFFILLIAFFKLAFMPAGVTFTDYQYSIINSSLIDKVNGIDIGGIQNFSQVVGNSSIVNVTVNGSTYFVSGESLTNLNQSALLKAYDDLPAFNAKIAGVINGLNNVTINTEKDIEAELARHKPGDNVTIRTTNGTINFYYNITLGMDPANKSVAYIGVAREVIVSRSLGGRVAGLVSMFKQEGVYYAPRIEGDFSIFIYNLIWWILIINLSVALVNMLPLGIFDGGRFFYLMVLSITKSKKIAEISFKIATYINLAIFALLMIFWAAAFF